MKKRTYLTTTSNRIQRFFKLSTKLFKKAKEKRLEDLIENHEFLYEKFPKKQWHVLDEIIYLTAETGVVGIKAETLAEKTGVSPRTISNFNENLLNTGEYVIERLRNSETNCAGLVYIDKKHKDFYEIMEHLFGLDKIQVIAKYSKAVAEPIAEPIAEQDFAETLDTQGIEGQKSDSHYYNYNNLNNLKDYTYSDVALKDMIIGLLSKHQKPQEMLHELYVVAKGIKNKFQNSLTASILDSLIVKSIKILFNSRYNNAYAFLSGTIKNLIDNALNTPKHHTEPAVAVTDEEKISQQDAIRQAKIDRAKNQNVPDWFKNDNPMPTSDPEAQKRKAMKRLGLI